MLTDRFDESLDFFTRVYGLKLSGQDESSAYLRGWDEYEFHSLKLTRSDTTGVGHVAYRTASPEAFTRRARAIEASGAKVHGWVEDDLGHGPAFRFEDPFGHVFEIYYETVRYRPEADDRPALKNLASRYRAAEVFLDLAPDGALRGAGTVRTARKLFDRRVFPRPGKVTDKVTGLRVDFSLTSP